MVKMAAKKIFISHQFLSLLFMPGLIDIEHTYLEIDIIKDLVKKNFKRRWLLKGRIGPFYTSRTLRD